MTCSEGQSSYMYITYTYHFPFPDLSKQRLSDVGWCSSNTYPHENLSSVASGDEARMIQKAAAHTETNLSSG